MATEVTPVSDLSSLTQVLPSLSKADLRALNTNIMALLDSTDDDDKDVDAGNQFGRKASKKKRKKVKFNA